MHGNIRLNLTCVDTSAIIINVNFACRDKSAIISNVDLACTDTSATGPRGNKLKPPYLSLMAAQVPMLTWKH